MSAMTRRSRAFRQAIIVAQVLTACATSLTHADLTSQIDELVAVPELQYALIGVHIVDAASGEVLYTRNADVRMQPASNQKLITSAAAYELLGADHVFKTRVLSDGKPDRDGNVNGNLYLRGGGDPSLKQKQIEAVAHWLHRAGVRRINGCVIADASAFSDKQLGTGWSWDYLDDYYAAEILPLTVDGGCVKVTVKAAERPGEEPSLSLEPSSEYLKLAPGAQTVTAAGEPGIYRYLGRNTVALTGPIAVGKTVERKITVRDPALYAGTLLKIALEKAGIAVAGGVQRGKTPVGAHELTSIDSPPLSTLIARINKNSDNNFAEILLRDISMVREEIGSRRGSVKLIDEWVGSFGGDPLAFLMYDGSGLSRMDSVTPRLLVQLLRHMHRKQPWVDSLAVAGRDGTLAVRMVNTPAEGRVQAKTGYVSGVRSLSGYARSRSGRCIIFSILVNNALSTHPAKRLQDNICVLLCEL